MSSHGEPISPREAASPFFMEEAVMKQALLNVVMDPKRMVLIVVLSQVIAIVKAIV